MILKKRKNYSGKEDKNPGFYDRINGDVYRNLLRHGRIDLNEQIFIRNVQSNLYSHGRVIVKIG